MTPLRGVRQDSAPWRARGRHRLPSTPVDSNRERLSQLLTVLTGEGELRPGDPERTAAVESALHEVASPDLATAFIGPDPTFRADYAGIEGFVEGWRDWMAPFESIHLELEEVIDAGESVVTLVRQTAIPTGASAGTEARGGAIWTFEGGRLSSVQFHLDRAQALRAAGIEPGRTSRD